MVNLRAKRSCTKLLPLDWTMLAAATITMDNVTLSNIISAVHGLASSQLSNFPFGVTYGSVNGTLISGPSNGIAR